MLVLDYYSSLALPLSGSVEPCPEILLLSSLQRREGPPFFLDLEQISIPLLVAVAGSVLVEECALKLAQRCLLFVVVDI